MITLTPQFHKIGTNRKEVYSLSVKNHGTTSVDDVVSLMSINNTITRPDALAVISALERRAAYWLAQGYSVSLGDLGTLQLRIGSKGVAQAAKYDVSSIKHTRVRFVPNVKLKQAIAKDGARINFRVKVPEAPVNPGA